MTIIENIQKICKSKIVWPSQTHTQDAAKHSTHSVHVTRISTRRKLCYMHANGVHGRTLAEVKCEFRQRYGVGGPEEGRLRLDVLSSYSAPAPNNMCR